MLFPEGLHVWSDALWRVDGSDDLPIARDAYDLSSLSTPKQVAQVLLGFCGRDLDHASPPFSLDQHYDYKWAGLRRLQAPRQPSTSEQHSKGDDRSQEGVQDLLADDADRASREVRGADDQRHWRAEEKRQAVVFGETAGGRQLDGVAPPLRGLSEVLDAVGDRAEVLLGGSIRRGGVVAKAVALGARAVLVGRAYDYGLAAAGREAVTRAIEILRSELERTSRLLGCPSVQGLDGRYFDLPANWPSTTN